MTKPPISQIARIAQAGQYTLTNNRELLHVLDAMRAVIFYLDRWGTVVYGNRRARRWRSIEETQGKSFVELAQHWDNAIETQREILQVGRTGVPVWGTRERAEEEGCEFWLSVDKIPAINEKQRVNGIILVVTDITENVIKEHALQDSEAKYKAFIANSADAIWRYDICPPIDTCSPVTTQVEQILKRAVLAECNDTLARLYNAESQADVVGMPLHRSGSMSSKHDIQAFIDSGYRLVNQEFTRAGKVDSPRYMETTAIGIVENGYLTRAWGITRDITAHKQYLDHMEYLANHDSLTRLPNRTLLYSTVEKALAEHGHNRMMALLLVDLDRFKEINDTLGHRAGDTVLQQLGPRLEAELSEVDGIVARLGGDEFAIFLPRIRNEQQAVVMGHRFLDCLCEPFRIETIDSEIGASIGVSLYPQQAKDLSTLMRYADVAMYHAKKTLKGVSVYDADHDPHSPTRLELIGALRRAIRKDDLLLYFQPKIDMKTNKVHGFEALVRWDHPTIGMVPPAQFVPIAEKSNMIFSMTCWVMEHAIKQCAIWRSKGYDLSMAINLSPRNVTDDRLLPFLKRMLKRYELDGKHIELEITESVILKDPDRAKDAMDKMALLGVCFAIDDYGTGYSSLAYLKRLPVKTLKIDRSFVHGMCDDEQDEIIVNSTINLAHNLGLNVVAEGVETDNVYQQLVSHQCDSVQGFFIARPMSVEVTTQWLQDSHWSCVQPMVVD